MSDEICQRCQRPAGTAFYIKDEEPEFFSDAPVTGPDISASCIDCLTDAEVAKFLNPAALFVVECMLREAQGKKPPNEELVRSLARVLALLKFKAGAAREYVPSVKAKDFLLRGVRSL